MLRHLLLVVFMVLSLVSLCRSNESRDAKLLWNAAVSVAPYVEERVRTNERLNKHAYEIGIDKKEEPGQSMAGPQYFTKDEATEIEKVGKAYVETTAGAAKELNIDKSIGRHLDEYQVPYPDQLLPKVMNCPFHQDNWPNCDPAAKYRSFDGSCNNLYNPLWGRANTPFKRDEAPDYDDGLSSPRTASTTGGTLPNARKISREFHRSIENPMSDLSHMAMEWGQFVSHDIQFNAISTGENNTFLDCCEMPDRPNCFPIQIPPYDPFFPAERTCLNFVRALPTPNLHCTIGPREQLNQNSHLHDGSQVYGSDKDTADGLRTFYGGKMRVSVHDGKDLLPGTPLGCFAADPENRPCFEAGDNRVNQQPALMSLQTIWLREHNRIAKRLADINPYWNDETLYQEARKIVIAEMQHITYNEYLPEILGEDIMEEYDLNPKEYGFYTDYSEYEKPIIRNGFSTAAYRFGHSMIFSKLPTYDAYSQTTNNLLKDTFLRPDLVYTHGVDQITRGLTTAPSESVDSYVTDQVTNHLFEFGAGTGGDLAATNIQRGRDHGIPAYQVWRRHCGLYGQFSHTDYVKNNLLNIYSSPEDIDLFTGGVSETPLSGAKVGPTFACMIGKQFRALKRGDRFYYENKADTGFTKNQLNEIRKVTLSNVICRNTHIYSIQKKALRQVLPDNALVGCDYIDDIDLTPWTYSYCTPVNGEWGPWQYTACSGYWKLGYRLCNNPAPNECGKACGDRPYEIEAHHCYYGDYTHTKNDIKTKVEKELSYKINDKDYDIDGSVFSDALSAVTGHKPYAASNWANVKWDHIKDDHNKWGNNHWDHNKWGNNHWDQDKWGNNHGDQNKWGNNHWDHNKGGTNHWDNNKWDHNKWGNNQWNHNNWGNNKGDTNKWGNNHWDHNKWGNNNWGNHNWGHGR